MVNVSTYFAARKPSPVRLAQLEFSKRTDDTRAINAAIGDVTLPMHPAMQQRLENVPTEFKNGINGYAPTVGLDEARETFLHIISSFGFETKDLFCNITEGGSAAMEIAILGCSDPDRPILLLDPAYANYKLLAKRTGRSVISVTRKLQEDGTFNIPDETEIEKVIEMYKPSAMVIIPYDNPTGQFFTQEKIEILAQLCVKHDMWIISDEAYRGLVYTNDPVSSVWAINEEIIQGIKGRRISIESSSKVWNACGLRIGALVTDNIDFHQKAVAESTATLGSNRIGQYIFGAINHESKEDLQAWYVKQREYYKSQMHQLESYLQSKIPNLIVSKPQAALYMVLDLRNVAPNFDSVNFVLFCAREGKVNIDGQDLTILCAPMQGFYNLPPEQNPGKTQLRIAFVMPPSDVNLMSVVFSTLIEQYLQNN